MPQHGRLREICGRIGQLVVTRQRALAFSRAGRSELSLERRQQRAAYEVRAGSDQAKVTLELAPRLVVRRVHPQLEPHARVSLSERMHAHRPGDLDEARLR